MAKIKELFPGAKTPGSKRMGADAGAAGQQMRLRERADPVSRVRALVRRKSGHARAVGPPDARVILHFFVRHRLLLAALVTSTLVGAVCAKLNTSGNLEVAGATT